jgi:hypothetical protein
MKARYFLMVAALCSTALAGCGSVTSDINFQAPGAGWTASPSILGRTQIWVKNAAAGKTHNSVVILVRGVNSAQEIFTSPGLGTNGKTQIVKNERTTICSGQPAQHIVASGEYSTSNQSGSGEQRADLEAYTTTVHDERYLAIYVHPESEPPDNQAETAIKSLCPKPA